MWDKNCVQVYYNITCLFCDNCFFLSDKNQNATSFIYVYIV
jgi:hypothetical protein